MRKPRWSYKKCPETSLGRESNSEMNKRETKCIIQNSIISTEGEILGTPDEYNYFGPKN